MWEEAEARLLLYVGCVSTAGAYPKGAMKVEDQEKERNYAEIARYARKKNLPLESLVSSRMKHEVASCGMLSKSIAWLVAQQPCY